VTGLGRRRRGRSGSHSSTTCRDRCSHAQPWNTVQVSTLEGAWQQLFLPSVFLSPAGYLTSAASNAMQVGNYPAEGISPALDQAF
jgi:hypothetical protein